MKKLLLYALFILLVFVACSEGDDYYVRRTDRVNIVEFTTPDTTLVTDTIDLYAKAQMDNGCWRDLFFVFNELSDSAAYLSAYGTFESYGSCPDIKVTKDTLIEFSPSREGIYIFYIARNYYQLIQDTLIVE